MSNTGFQINGVDLINIYNTNGTKSTTNTGFQSNNNDLKNIFGAYISGTNKYTTTGAYSFTTGGTTTDLKDFFLFATVSSAPTALSSPSKTSSSISLTWTAPTSNGGSAITGYIVYYGSSNVNTGSTATTYNLSGLNFVTSYTIYVVAVNGVGNSVGSNTINVTTNSTFPSAPTSLSSPSKTGTSISLSWTAPISNGGSPITGYIVYYGSNNVNTGTTATTYNLSGLSNGTPYSIYVVAVNNVGNSGNSNTISVTTNSKPSAPTSLSSSSVTSSSFTVNWLEPSSDGGSLIQNYSVNGNIVTSTTRSYGFSNLQPATLYTITIFAINAVGNGTTASINITTSATFPSIPTGVYTLLPTTTSIRLLWSPPSSNGGSAITGYVVTITINNVMSYYYPTVTEYTFTGLTAGTQYKLTVGAINAFGYSSDVTLYQYAGSRPGQPTNFRITATYSYGFDLAWNASAAGTSALRYYINGSDVGTGTSTTNFRNNLQPSTDYTFTIVARNLQGDSVSSSVSGTTAGGGPIA